MSKKILVWMIVLLVLSSVVIAVVTKYEAPQTSVKLKSLMKGAKQVDGQDYYKKTISKVNYYFKIEKVGNDQKISISNSESFSNSETYTYNNLENSFTSSLSNFNDDSSSGKTLSASIKKGADLFSTFQSNDNAWDKANTYQFGGDNYEKKGENGDYYVLEKVGKTSTFKGVGGSQQTKITQYYISKDSADFQKALKDKGVSVKSSIKPIAFDDKTMSRADPNDPPEKWTYKNDKKLNGKLAGESVKLPTSYSKDANLKSSLDKYIGDYGGKNVELLETDQGYTVYLTVGGSKLSKEERGKIKDAGILGNLLSGSSKETKIIAMQGAKVGDYLVTQEWETQGDKTGVFKGTYFNTINKDGTIEKVPGVTISAAGFVEGLDKVTDPKLKAAINTYAKKRMFNHVMGSLQRAQAWSSISSLFGFELTEWRQTVDEMFHSMFLGSEYWSEAICYQTTDLPDLDESSIFAYDADGNLMQTATIVATKQIIGVPIEIENNVSVSNQSNITKEAPKTNQKYLYKISYYVRNPESSADEDSSSGDFQRDSSSSSLLSSSSGLRARGEMGSSSDPTKLDKDEKEFWNVIKKGAKEISNSKSKSSRSATNEDMEYNIELSGDKTLLLYQENEIIKPGGEAMYTKEDSIASYSVSNYERACIVFDGEKPRNLFYEEVDEICTDIIDISGEGATTIPVVDDSRSSSGRTTSNEFGEFSGSSGSSSSRSFTK